MKYKGYELVIDIDETNKCFVYRIPGLSSQSTIYGEENPDSRHVLQWFHDTVDLHIGRSAERETCEKRIDPEEVAKVLYEYVWPGERLENSGELKEKYMDEAKIAIACIKKIDPSIISDDINHGVKHKFDKIVIAKKIADQIYGEVDWEKRIMHTKNKCTLIAEDIISYIEEIIYG